MTDKIHELLNYWFGNLGSADLPNSDRTNLWFGNDDTIKQQLLAAFTQEYKDASDGRLSNWEKTPRGRLALIILFDQFSRFFHKHSSQAFSFDQQAQALCLEGLRERMDQSLTLIERVFFYMPLVHSEDAVIQEKSIRLYQELVALSMSETTQVYQLFLAYAYAHFRVIKEFGRFPQRNALLGRESTEAELAFLRHS
jgi:uncharacterized protein (DUF924 family)